MGANSSTARFCRRDAKENEIDTSPFLSAAKMDKERDALNEEKSNLNITLPSLSSRKEEESTRLVEIRHNDNNKVNINMINNNSGSSNDVNCTSTMDNNTNEFDVTTITWENRNSLWIQPKSLTINYCENIKCWTRVNYNWWGSVSHEVACLLRVHSLKMRGNYKIEEDLLQQGVSYELLFWVGISKVGRESQRFWVRSSTPEWESPIHVRLTLPDGRTQANQLILDTTPSKELYISVGNFVTPMKGEIKFSLEQLDNKLKGGTVIEGVIIQPSFAEIVNPKDLSIKFHHVGECWRWATFNNSYAKGLMELVELISVRDLKVDGIFDTERLVFGCTYKVGFLIELRSAATGWENPTKMTLRLPNGCLQQIRGNFNDMPRDKDIQIYVGEFKMSPEMIGKLEFSMENNIEVGKTGMFILLAFIQQQH